MKWLFSGGARDEEDTERDGFLSTSVEIHASVNGFYKGAFGMKPNPEEPDSKAEIHYFRGVFVFGRAISIVAALLTGGFFL